MKIAIIADPLDEQYAGIYVYTKEFIEALERVNSEHEIVYIHQRENQFFKGKKELIVPLKRRIPLWATFRKFFWLPFILRRHKFDLVHDLSHIAPFTFWGNGYKKVVTIHDLTPVLFPEWHVRASTIVHRFIFPLIFKRADLVIADSDHTKADILDRYGVRGRIESVFLAARSSVSCVPRDVAKKKLKEKYGIEGDFILYVGTLEPRKNLGFLLDIFEQLKIEHAFSGSLVLVGKQGWFLQQFKERLDRMDDAIRKRIILTGYVDEADLGYFYSAAELFVYPSFYEGFGLPPVEAMKCGCPVIVASNSSLTEVTGEGGVLLSGFDRDGWCVEIKKVLSDDAYRDRLVQAGFTRAADFDWDIHIKHVLRLYEEILRG